MYRTAPQKLDFFYLTFGVQFILSRAFLCYLRKLDGVLDNYTYYSVEIQTDDSTQQLFIFRNYFRREKLFVVFF